MTCLLQRGFNLKMRSSTLPALHLTSYFACLLLSPPKFVAQYLLALSLGKRPKAVEWKSNKLCWSDPVYLRPGSPGLFSFRKYTSQRAGAYSKESTSMHCSERLLALLLHFSFPIGRAVSPIDKAPYHLYARHGYFHRTQQMDTTLDTTLNSQIDTISGT